DLFAEALYARRHRKHGGDPEHGAEEGERGAQLVGAELLQRDEPPLRHRMEFHESMREPGAGSGEQCPTVRAVPAPRSRLPAPRFIRIAMRRLDPTAPPAWPVTRRRSRPHSRPGRPPPPRTTG